MSQNKPLTAKQESFCLHYVANGFNATQAAISAGYSEDTANEQGARLLVNVSIKTRIEELKAKTNKKAEMTAEELIAFIDYAINFDPSEWMDVVTTEIFEKKTGRTYEVVHSVLKCKLSELPPMTRKMATKIKPTKFGVEVEWFSKEKAADMKARFLSLYNDRVTVERKGDLSPEEMEELAELRGKMGKSIPNEPGTP